MSELEDKIVEQNKEVVEKAKLEEQEQARLEKEMLKEQRRERREEAVSNVINAVKAPFVAIKESIVKAHQAKVDEKIAKEELKTSYDGYLKFAEESKGKDGTIEIKEQEDGSKTTILYTESGPLIETCKKIESSEYTSHEKWEYGYKGFFSCEDGTREFRDINLTKTTWWGINYSDMERYESDERTLNPVNNEIKILHDGITKKDGEGTSYRNNAESTKGLDTMNAFNDIQKAMQEQLASNLNEE